MFIGDVDVVGVRIFLEYLFVVFLFLFCGEFVVFFNKIINVFVALIVGVVAEIGVIRWAGRGDLQLKCFVARNPETRAEDLHFC